MIRIGKRVLGGAPTMVVSINDRISDRRIRTLPIDVLELRVDQFKRLDPIYVKGVVARVKRTGLPLILTVRSKDEGGCRHISDKLKLDIIKMCAKASDAVDIELRSPILSDVVKTARKNRKVVIVSWHDFRKTPNDKMLKDILNRAKRNDADIVKIAAHARKMGDVDRLMRFTLKNRKKNLITISLGVIGSISRLIFPRAGSLITYAYIDRPSGPGQMLLEKFREQLCLYYPNNNSKRKACVSKLAYRHRR